MDNRDWKISEQEATKFFLFDDDETAGDFIREVRKLARSEDHIVRFRRMKNGEIRVKVPVPGPDTFTEKEVRLMNLINKLGG